MVTNNALSDALHKLPASSELQKQIGRIPGVIMNRVVLSNQLVSAIHILADARIDAARVAFDIKSLFKETYGIEIERRCISVALLRRPDPNGPNRAMQLSKSAKNHPSHYSSPPLNPIVKPHVRHVITDRKGHGSIRVTLNFDDDVIHGEADGAGAFSNQIRLAADAALDAYEKYLQQNHWARFGEDCRLVLKDLVPFDLSGCTGFLSGVVFLTQGKEVQLAGSALVKDDDMLAAASAACNAVDRHVVNGDDDQFTTGHSRLNGTW